MSFAAFPVLVAHSEIVSLPLNTQTSVIVNSNTKVKRENDGAIDSINLISALGICSEVLAREAAVHQEQQQYAVIVDGTCGVSIADIPTVESVSTIRWLENSKQTQETCCVHHSCWLSFERDFQYRPTVGWSLDTRFHLCISVGTVLETGGAIARPLSELAVVWGPNRK